MRVTTTGDDDNRKPSRQRRAADEADKEGPEPAPGGGSLGFHRVLKAPDKLRDPEVDIG